MFGEGVGADVIAAALGRTPHAIRVRHLKVGKVARIAERMKTREERDARIDEMLKDGMSHADIAAAMGLNRQWIGVIARSLGYRAVERITQPRVDMISDMLARGRSRSTIARKLGVTNSYVYYHVRRLGLVGPKTVVNVFIDQVEENDRIRQMANDGKAVSHIAREIGSCCSNVRSRLMTMALRDEVMESNGPSAVRYVERRAA
jgi:hypothetical protein